MSEMNRENTPRRAGAPPEELADKIISMMGAKAPIDDQMDGLEEVAAKADRKWRRLLTADIFDGVELMSFGVVTLEPEETERLKNRVQHAALAAWMHCLLAWAAISGVDPDFEPADEPPQADRDFLVGMMRLIMETYNRAGKLANSLREATPEVGDRPASLQVHMMRRTAQFKAVQFAMDEFGDTLCDHIARVAARAPKAGGAN